MTLDDRLRAASDALKDGSVTQVDAAGGLREIVHAGRSLPTDPAAAAPDGPAPPGPDSPRLRRAQRLALAVNLALALVLGAILVVVAAGRDPDAGTFVLNPPATSSAATTVVTRTVVQVPSACLDSAQLAEEVISKLNRNDRDDRLALALRDWSVASARCREQAATATTVGG